MSNLSDVWQQRSRPSPSWSSVVRTLLRLICVEHGNTSLSSSAVSPAGRGTRRKPGAGNCQPCSGCSGETRLSAVLSEKSRVCWLSGFFNKRSAGVMKNKGSKNSTGYGSLERESVFLLCCLSCSCSCLVVFFFHVWKRVIFYFFRFLYFYYYFLFMEPSK